MNASTLEIPCEIPADARNPVEPFLRMDRMPHIWCPACGIGTTVNCFTRALEESNANLDKVAVVSGIGCTGRVAGYANLDSFHTTHGRAIPFATGLKLSNPELQVVVYSGDGDLFAIGGNHFIHAARRNMDLKVICVNNLTYAMTGGQTAPTTPGQVISALRSVATRTGKHGPTMTVGNIATYLKEHGTPGFGEQLLSLLARTGSADF